MPERKQTLVDVSYSMALRNDAALLHLHCARAGHDTSELFYTYAQACLTTGCLDAWKSLLHDGDKEARQLINSQPAIQLSNAVAEISVNQFSMSCIEAHAGVVTILDWVEGGCIGSSPFQDDIAPHPVWPVPAPLKERLTELRQMRFGWIVCPESGDYTRQAPELRGSMNPETGWITVTFSGSDYSNDYSEVWVSEEQLARYRQNLPWPDVMA